jgi:hypothetical protein
MNGEALLFVRMLAPRDKDAEFETWYTTEHLPPRLAIPGFLSGRTYRDADGALIGLYELESAAILESPAYKRLQSADATDTKSHVSELDEFQRLVLTQT